MSAHDGHAISQAWHDLPTIDIVKGELHVAADKGLKALQIARVPFYQRDGRLVRVTKIRAKASDGTVIMVPGIAGVPLALLRRALCQSAVWQRFDMRAKRWLAIDPPNDVVEQIAVMSDEWPFPILRGIINCPTLRCDGSLLSAEGYDEATGLVLYSNVSMPRIPSQPNRADANIALALLKSLLIEFPFTNESARSVALSMLVTPVLRGAMEVAPLHMMTAPEAGSGKSYLADLASAIAVGERAPAVSTGSDKKEMEARLIGAALNGFPIISLDNVSTTLEGDFLCQVTERPLLQLRALGKSDIFRVPNTFTTFANGNNISAGGDMTRRTIHGLLDTNKENPETRTFDGDPLATILNNRGAYVAAALTIALAYRAADRPRRDLAPLPSYEEWSRIVREPLVWLGMPDPIETMGRARDVDPVRLQRAAVYKAWYDELDKSGAGYRTNELIEHVGKADYQGKLLRPELHVSLLAVAARRGLPTQIDERRLGQWLAKNESTIAAGMKLQCDRSDKARPQWKLIEHI